MAKGKSGSAVKQTSSGMTRSAKARRALGRLMMKIARWERYKTDPSKTSSWSRKQNPRKRSRHDKWNVAGLKRHAETLQAVIKKGCSTRAT